jgi:hypothetical protein
MRRVFWALVLLAAYVWSVTTGRDQLICNQGKRVYQFVAAWVGDAEVDLQVQKQVSTTPANDKKKRSRRWD